MSKPTTTIRIGSVIGNVFVNEVDTDGGKRQIRSVSLQRSYCQDNETKYSSSFGIADIPVAIRVLQLAQEQIEKQEAFREAV